MPTSAPAAAAPVTYAPTPAARPTRSVCVRFGFVASLRHCSTVALPNPIAVPTQGITLPTLPYFAAVGPRLAHGRVVVWVMVCVAIVSDRDGLWKCRKVRANVVVVTAVAASLRMRRRAGSAPRR